MALSNPGSLPHGVRPKARSSLGFALQGVTLSTASWRERAERYRAASEAILHEVEECQRLLDIVVDSGTLSRYWQGQERARITIRSLGHLLEIDLAAFAEQIAPDLLASIDDLRPDEARLGDGRAAAERLHYAWSLRALLLQHVLTIVNSSYSPPCFQDLASAIAWISSYSDILQEAEAVLDETQLFLHDEAVALQSFLDKARARLKRLEQEAHASGILLRRDWREARQRAEDEIIARLAGTSEELSHLHFEVHVGAPFSSNWRVPFKGGKFVDPVPFFPDS